MLTKKMLFIMAVITALSVGCNNQLTRADEDAFKVSEEISESRGYNPNKPTYIVFYSDVNYKGSARSFVVSEMSRNFDPSRMDNKISSFKWVNNYYRNRVILYNEKDSNGISFSKNMDVPNLVKYGFNDLASSFKLSKTNEQKESYAIIYSEKNFSGRQDKLYFSTKKNRWIDRNMRRAASSIKIVGDQDFYLYDGYGNFTVVQSPGLADLRDAGFDNKAVTYDNWGPYEPYAIFYSGRYEGTYRVLNKPESFYDINFHRRASSVRVNKGRIGISGSGMARSLSGNVVLSRLYNRVESMDYIRSADFD